MDFTMKGIRTALEKAGIAERIEIIIGNRKGIIIQNLGKYEPKVGESVRFQSISDKFEDPLTAFDLRSIETETFQLVFKNSRGETDLLPGSWSTTVHRSPNHFCLPAIIRFSARCRPPYIRRARDPLDPAYAGEYR